MKLTSSAASPFARKVRICAIELGLIDRIVLEPVGGAHRDAKQMSSMLKRALADSLRQFQGVKVKDLLASRHARLMGYGKFKETSTDS